MNKDLSALYDPYLGGQLKKRNNHLFFGENSYPIISKIPRFISDKNYAEDFGVQWNRFSKVQLDSYTETDITESRLKRCLQNHLSKIKNKLVLEAGSGAGRFTEILLKKGAIVHSFDYSNAVEANYLNNKSFERLTLVQADIRAMPFKKNAYDYVICLGVLQHTPNPEQSIRSLYKMVKPGGYLVVDHYLFKWRYIIPPPFGGSEMLYRKVLLLLSQNKRFNFVKKIVDFWFPLHWKFRSSLTIQRIIRRISPLHFYYLELPLKKKKSFYEWSLLDTHDGLTDYYKHYRSLKQIRNFLLSLYAEDIIVTKGGNGIEAFCRKPLNQ